MASTLIFDAVLRVRLDNQISGSLDNIAKGSLKNIGAGVDTVNTKINNMASGLTVRLKDSVDKARQGLSESFFKLGMSIFNSAAGYDAWMQKLKTALKFNATDKNNVAQIEKSFKDIGISIEKLAKKWGILPEEAAKAVYELTQGITGFSSTQIPSMIEEIGALAKATGASFTDTTDMMITGYNAFYESWAKRNKLNVNELSTQKRFVLSLGEAISTTVQTTGLRGEDLRTVFANMGKQLVITGKIGIEQIIGWAGVLRNAGMSASSTGTALKNMGTSWIKLLQGTGAFGKGPKKKGILADFLGLTDDNMVMAMELPELLGKIATRMTQVGDKDATGVLEVMSKVFPDMRARQAWLNLATQISQADSTLLKIDNTTKKITSENYLPQYLQIAEENTKNTQDEMARWEANIMVLKNTIAETLVPVLRTVLDIFTPVIDLFRWLVNLSPGTVRAITFIATAFMTWNWISAMVNRLNNAITMFLWAQETIKMPTLWQNIGNLWKFAGTHFHNFVNSFQVGWGRFSSFLNSGITNMGSMFSRMGNAINGWWNTLGGYFSNMGSMFSKMGNSITSIATKTWDWLSGTAVKVWEAVKSFGIYLATKLGLIPANTAVAASETAAGVAGATAGTATSIAWGPVLLVIAAVIAAAALIIIFWKPISKFFIGLWKTVSDWFVKTWEGIKVFFAGLWKWIVNAAKIAFDILTWIIFPIPRLIIKFWDPIKNFFVNLWGGISRFFASVWKGIVVGAKVAFDVLTWIFAWPVKLIIKFWDPIKNFFKNLWDGITGMIRSAINGIVGFFRNLITDLLSIIPDWLLPESMEKTKYKLMSQDTRKSKEQREDAQKRSDVLEYRDKTGDTSVNYDNWDANKNKANTAMTKAMNTGVKQSMVKNTTTNMAGPAIRQGDITINSTTGDHKAIAKEVKSVLDSQSKETYEKMSEIGRQQSKRVIG